MLQDSRSWRDVAACLVISCLETMDGINIDIVKLSNNMYI